MKRLCIYAHYDRQQKIQDYVVFQLKAYADFFDHIVFVSTSCSVDELQKIKPYSDSQILRGNQGYDFQSWKTGLATVPEPTTYDEMIWTNDSVYGPLFPLKNMFESMVEKQCDFWSATKSFELSPHLQSYFMVFKRKMFDTEAFEDWCSSLHPLESKKDYVTKIEIPMTAHFENLGFVSDAFFKPKFSFTRWLENTVRMIAKTFVKSTPRSESMTPLNARRARRTLNPTLRQWKDLLQVKVPFIKTQIFRQNPLGEDLEKIKETIIKETTYPASLIESHIQSQ